MPAPSLRVVVLLGAPGSGKSTVGRELAERGLRWRTWEQVILERWGSRAAFVAAKETALPELQREQRAWIDEDGPLAAIESTGLSDAPFLDALVADGVAFVVRLDVTEDDAARRVTDRPQGEHLSDDESANRALWRLFEDHVKPDRAVDLVIDTARTAADLAAERIAAAIVDHDR